MMTAADKNRLIVVTGPTATGKTAFAARLAARIGGEIISADSRQVYRGMDLATGKDRNDYVVDGTIIPGHLTDIADPGYEYNVYEFQRDFERIYREISGRGKIPVLCGGTGLYIESVLRGYRLVNVPQNQELRRSLQDKTINDLIKVLEAFKMPHNVTDTKDINRLIRAIEIQTHYREHPETDRSFPVFDALVFGIRFEREEIRNRITLRLKQRLDRGMLEEVRALLQKGLTPEQLKFYGLEYRYLTRYVVGEITYAEMFSQLNTAIHQFAKRQMTWFRKMEREGLHIHWIEGTLPMQEKLEQALQTIGHRDF